MTCPKTDYGMNDYDPNIIRVTSMEDVMGEARSTYGRHENGTPNRNQGAYRLIANFTGTSTWFCKI
jgi:hypothetical protein